MYTPSAKEYLEVSVELADTVVDLNLMEELIDQVVKDVKRTITEQQAMPLWLYEVKDLDT